MSPGSRDLLHLESWIWDVRQVQHCLKVQNIGIADSSVIFVLLAWAFLPPQVCSRFPSRDWLTSRRSRDLHGLGVPEG